MRPGTVVQISEMADRPYASVLCYPCTDSSVINERIEELKSCGVTAVEFGGNGRALGVPVLGKGHTGIVVIAHAGGKRTALKMRRPDGNKEDMFREAEMLQAANNIGIGPKFIAVTKNFLIYELIDGDIIENWMSRHTEKDIKKMMTDILMQCRRLDDAGIDHGELRIAPRHLLVGKDGRPYMIDLETASTDRNAINVSSVCHYFFFGKCAVRDIITNTMGEADRDGIVEALRDYKSERSDASFKALLKACRL